MKKKAFVILLMSTILILLMACSPLPGLIAVPEGIPLPADVFNVAVMIMLGFASLIGVSKLVTVLVNLLKLTGLVKDGTSDRWAAGFNLLAFIALVLLGVFRPDLTMKVLDGYAGQIAAILLFILGFVSQMIGSKTGHDALSAANIPLIGKSFSK